MKIVARLLRPLVVGIKFCKKFDIIVRGGSRTATKSKMERFVIIVNDFWPLTIITKRSILDVAVVLDLPLIIRIQMNEIYKHLIKSE